MGGVNAKVMDTKGGHSREITVFNKLVRHIKVMEGNTAGGKR